MLVCTWMLIWKIFVSIDLRFGNSRMLSFCSERVFDKWNQLSHNKGMKFCVFSRFESLELRCKMTVMPQDRFQGMTYIILLVCINYRSITRSCRASFFSMVVHATFEANQVNVFPTLHHNLNFEISGLDKSTSTHNLAICSRVTKLVALSILIGLPNFVSSWIKKQRGRTVTIY